MSVEICENTKVFILCPANVATGGPELLHQLAYHLRKIYNLEVYMYYFQFNKRKFHSPVCEDYKKYNIPYVLEISKEDDVSSNILISPEINDALQELKKYKNIRKGIWILSVDNYYLSKFKLSDFFIRRVVNKISRIFFNKNIFDLTDRKVLEKLINRYDYKKDNILKNADFVITNSYRGMEWFSDLKPYFLSEYVNEEFLENTWEFIKNKKENIVVYNPKKGFNFTKKIIKTIRKKYKNIKFVKLENMTREEIKKSLLKAKVYIDFGNHPGKDRLPREAAVSGCCVITGKRGSAAFFEDVPIDEEFKFEDKEENIPFIVDKIIECIENYDENVKKFEFYRNKIKKEKEEFLNDLKKIFVLKESGRFCGNNE